MTELKGVTQMTEEEIKEREMKERRETRKLFELTAELTKQGFSPADAKTMLAAVNIGSPELLARALQSFHASNAANAVTQQIEAERKTEAERAELNKLIDEVDNVLGTQTGAWEREQFITKERARAAAAAASQEVSLDELSKQMDAAMDPFNQFQLDKPLE